MNDTFEIDFFKTVANLENVSVYDFPRLNYETANLISKALTKKLYQSMKDTSPIGRKYRETLYKLIYMWSSKLNTHATINDENRHIFLNYISHVTDKRQNNILSCCGKLENRDIYKDILETWNSLKNMKFRKKTKAELIQAIDCIYLQETGFNYTVPMKITNMNIVEERISLLNNLVNDSEHQTEKFERVEKINIDISIALGYSLLNLEKNQQNCDILMRIINDIGKKSKIEKIEENFLNYIWKNKDKLELPPAICDKLFQDCPFVYEIPLIKLATELIEAKKPMTKSDIKNFVKSSILFEVLKKCGFYKNIIINVKSILYELFTISNYDKRFLYLIDIIE